MEQQNNGGLFKSKNCFIKKFIPDSKSGFFYDPIPLDNCKYGFSIKRKYPKEIKFTPTKTRADDDDEIAIIWVTLDLENTKTITFHYALEFRL